METAQTLLILTNMPDVESARALGERLVRGRLAACVNILAPCQSIFRWRDAVDEASEVPLLIKAAAAAYPALEAAILAGHPYELPEIIAVPIARGLPDYLSWVAAETLPAATESPAAC